MNRKKANFLSVLIITIGSAVAQPNSTGFYLKGFVLSNDTTTIPLANIENISNGKRYISNRFGAFGITVDINDTLVFSVIGYQNVIMPVKPFVERNFTDPIKVKMKAATYKLKEVEVNYNKRKRDSIATKAAEMIKRSPMLNDYNHIYSFYSGSTTGHLTSILGQSSKKVQEYERLLRLIALYQEQQKVDERYNVKLIMRATGLNEIAAEELKRFCNLPNYFVLNSNDYDIVMAIKNCYTEFKQQR
ncbi:MAG: hypothetical protein ACK4K9_09100 [Bacteroidia bacterium]